ncbi:hypothetical protein MYCTH_2301910 [Thermothelomyces thermophilus ATCC 42464]|uniref:CFEM domain-containing protein n=1 Tax=Thermothelomyces thermophilus (strain ATCC 42464 / BCRC 31852 / DSM 1799) TaxID=573729 RepID=G2QAL0_THET4|nr:uncharacterized protein MYCTH_2301910 [Thermothelomyces thermophilus ATCC 42464]AEO56706.1 hypothetical protein MYCTH_2301910 [Thermothelomyces thermophilus ATCC 42464]
MKYTSAVLALAAATATATAQDISIFPECSMPCIIDAVGKTSCELTDFACVCKNMDSIKQGATSCVVDKCGIDVALNEVLPATEQFCADVGDGDGDGDDGEGEGDGGSESSSAPAPPATSTTTTTLVTSTTKAPEEPSPSATEAPGGGGDEDDGDDGDDDEDDGDDGEDEPTGTTSSPGSIITSEPTGSAIPSGGDDEDTPPATSSIATAGAAVVGAMGSFGMMLLGAVAAL